MADYMQYYDPHTILFLTDDQKKIIGSSFTSINLLHDYFTNHSITDFSHFKYDFSTADPIETADLDLTTTWLDNTKTDNSSIVSHETLQCNLVSTIIIDDITLYIYSYFLDDGETTTPTEG